MEQKMQKYQETMSMTFRMRLKRLMNRLMLLSKDVLLKDVKVEVVVKDGTTTMTGREAGKEASTRKTTIQEVVVAAAVIVTITKDLEDSVVMNKSLQIKFHP